jgi:hypothetical protein
VAGGSAASVAGTVAGLVAAGPGVTGGLVQAANTRLIKSEDNNSRAMVFS